MSDAETLKAQGNAAFSAGNFQEAIGLFTQAIEKDPNNHVLYSNRSACNASLKEYADALVDANKCVALKPDWPKGYSRIAAAQVGMQRYSDAIEACKKGLELDPNNAALKKSLEQAEEAAAHPSGAGAGLAGMFSSPEFLAKLATNPSTRHLVGDQAFLAKLQMMQTNPNNLGMFMKDPDIMQALQVGLGISMMSPGDAAAAEADAGDSASSAPEPPKPAPPAPEPEPEPEPEPVDDEELAKRKRKQDALEEKAKGNAHYKKKEFSDAIKCYDAAIALDDTDISFLTNRAAVHYEMKDFDKCMEDCDTAITRGREVFADYKLVARAMTRKGNAMVMKKDLEGAIEIYKEALLEHRNPDTLQRLNDTEKALKKQKEEAYIDLELSNKEKEEGNTLFKEHKYPEAVKCYTEALQRGPPSVNPEAYKVYSNRAACYIKLGALPEAEKDADKCIELCPTFAKGYSRKGHVQYLMKEYNKSMKTYNAGLKQDPENAELKQGVQNCIQQMNAMNSGQLSEEEIKQRQERAMADPEIQGILTDPVMRQVLQDLQENPKAAQHHLQNPDIMHKIQTLAGAGIIQLR